MNELGLTVPLGCINSSSVIHTETQRLHPICKIKEYDVSICYHFVYKSTSDLEGGRISGKSDVIPSVVSRELTSEVLRNIAGEGTKPLGAIGSVPFNVAGEFHSLVSSLFTLMANHLTSNLLDRSAGGHKVACDASDLNKRVGLLGSHVCGSRKNVSLTTSDLRRSLAHASHPHGGSLRRGADGTTAKASAGAQADEDEGCSEGYIQGSADG
mmetsp:Transcript_29607/g.47297  ORF Transcript_29607/g.47297 Transcript_29607/m.47297 type:complete len:212 (+) Transcript_29607:638-1273(+)